MKISNKIASGVGSFFGYIALLALKGGGCPGGMWAFTDFIGVRDEENQEEIFVPTAYGLLTLGLLKFSIDEYAEWELASSSRSDLEEDTDDILLRLKNGFDKPTKTVYWSFFADNNERNEAGETIQDEENCQQFA